MARVGESISEQGATQQDIVSLLRDLRALAVELRADAATQKTFNDEVKADIGIIATFQAALTAKLDADAGITDTDYASSLTEVVAMTASPPATITAADPTITVDAA